MSDKRYQNRNSIILNGKNTIENDPFQVEEIFNDFFTSVASGICFDNAIVSAADAIRKHKAHPRVVKNCHEFDEINGELDFPKEATGYDNIPGKMIR